MRFSEVLDKLKGDKKNDVVFNIIHIYCNYISFAIPIIKI
jgi:hypothetical protein